jgi:serine-type D-Ala-D-Ala carboxypeptidase/endopeptidase
VTSSVAGRLSAAIANIDAIAAAFQRKGEQPGMAYGIIADGQLLHASGLGERWIGGPAPDADTVFRIASMTKSFTAAGVLQLRDVGALHLDDPVEAYVPELSGMKGPTADSPRLTIRHLLTMAGGLPKDDAWADRQQGISDRAFSEMLRDGFSFARAPGTRYEYSNLGYAILGRVASAAAGIPYDEIIVQRLLEPLGMAHTGFVASQMPSAALAKGYRRVDDQWMELPFDDHGAFAPMGGLFSTVRDLADWVAGFTGAYPPRDDIEHHPLRRSSRREVQQPHNAIPLDHKARPIDELARCCSSCYGYGLFVDDDSRLGVIVRHSGGYPGFGSHMRWHPKSRIGVVVLANSTYAPARMLAAEMLDSLLSSPSMLPPSRRGGTTAGVPDLAPGGCAPWPATLAARLDVNRLLVSWSDSIAQHLFAESVALDEPLDRRRAEIDRIRQEIGEVQDEVGQPLEHDSAAHCAWWLRGPRGRVRAEIRLTPERTPRVQSLRLTPVPEPDSRLRGLLDTLLVAINDGATIWPSSLPTAPSLDRERLTRLLRLASAWVGTCRLAEFYAGDGTTNVTAKLAGTLGQLILMVSTEPDDLLVTGFTVSVDGEESGGP